MLRHLARLLPLGLVALALGACSSAPAASSSSSGSAVSEDDCPDGLVDLVMRDDDGTWLSDSVATTCVDMANTRLEDPAALERYLARHPFVTLGQPDDFVAKCMDRWEHGHRKLDAAHRTAIVGNYYFLLDTLKQAGLSTLEELAGIDLLLHPERPPLPEGDGVVYEHPLIHQSGDWLRRLRWNCTGRVDRFDELVEITNATLWTARKLSAGAAEWRAMTDRATASLVEKNAQQIDDARDAVVRSTAPWLVGKALSPLQSNRMSLERMRDAEQTFGIVDARGLVRPKAQWSAAAGNPLVAQEAEVRKALREQLTLDRRELERRLARIFAAAEHLHLDQSRMSRGDLQATLDAASPFNPRVFGAYYETAEFAAAFSHEGLAALEADVRALERAHPSTKVPPWIDPATLDVARRIAQMEAALAALDAANVDVTRARARLAKLRAAYEEAANGLSAQAELSAAKCRSSMRSTNDALRETGDMFAMNAALVFATAGLGTWLAVARVAASVDAAEAVGLQWGSRAMTLAASGAGAAARAGVTYEQQAKILWGALLGANVYFSGAAVVDTILTCNELINDKTLKLFDAPFDPHAQTCLQGLDPLAHQAIASYRACAAAAAITIGLNALALLPGAASSRGG